MILCAWQHRVKLRSPDRQSDVTKCYKMLRNVTIVRLYYYAPMTICRYEHITISLYHDIILCAYADRTIKQYNTFLIRRCPDLKYKAGQFQFFFANTKLASSNFYKYRSSDSSFHFDLPRDGLLQHSSIRSPFSNFVFITRSHFD